MTRAACCLSYWDMQRIVVDAGALPVAVDARHVAWEDERAAGLPATGRVSTALAGASLALRGHMRSSGGLLHGHDDEDGMILAYLADAPGGGRAWHPVPESEVSRIVTTRGEVQTRRHHPTLGDVREICAVRAREGAAR